MISSSTESLSFMLLHMYVDSYAVTCTYKWHVTMHVSIKPV